MIWLLAACGPPTPEAAPPTPELLEGPVILHEVPEGVWLEGEALELMATAVDPDGVRGMELRHRVQGELFYERVEMEPGDDGTFSTTLTTRAPGVEYLFRAFDDSDWRIPGVLPPEAEAAPFRVTVTRPALVAPWEEGFDGDTAFGLYDLGWTEHALDFRGNRWRQSTLRRTGTHSARHDAGYRGMPFVDDWLVGPVLDFRGLETAEVRWWENGLNTEGADHTLWISTGSPDPLDGAFVQVAELAPPVEGRWAAVPVVDLTPWAGEPRVTLAWRYRGEGESDRWAIDDVTVRLFGPDLQLREATPTRLDPQSTGAIDVHIVNGGAPTAGSVTLEATADGDATFGPAVDLGPFATQDAAQVTLPLTLGAVPDNTVLHTDLFASDGVDGWSWPVPVLVGDPTAALVRFHVVGTGLVQVFAGVGEPVQPNVEEVLFQGQLQTGIYTVSADLADHLAWLPSEPGRGRWWTRIEAEPQVSLLGFGIDHDGELIWSDDTGPVTGDGRFWLPQRAEPVVTDVSADPSPLRPGQDGTIVLTLANVGGPTVGQTQLRLSGDAALGLQETILPLPPSWTGSTTVEVPVSVAASHTDSQPLFLRLDVVDTGEVYRAEVDVPVPWPRLAYAPPLVTGSDAVLDPGEQVGLLIDVRNDGALATGPLTCSFVQTGGPTASITSSVALQALQPGQTRALNATLTATGAVDGDNLAFELTCADGLASWPTSFVLGVGGAPWIPIGTDPIGDAGAMASFDLTQVRFRQDGTLLELLLVATDPIDAATVDFELWTDSPQSTWRNVALTVQDGEAELFGIQSGGWTALPGAQLEVDGNTVRIGLPQGGIGLVNDELQLAIGTGFCATPELFCEHWPDGWGNPYVGTPDSTHWPSVSW